MDEEGFNFTPEDDGVYQIVLTVTDDDGGTTTTSQTVEVTNVAPEIVIAGDPSVNEGAIYTLSLSAGGDPGADTVSQWVIDWGDGTTQTVTGNPSSVTHVYADGAADYMIFPGIQLLLRALALPEARELSSRFLPVEANYPALGRWLQRVAALPGYDRTYPPHWRVAS